VSTQEPTHDLIEQTAFPLSLLHVVQPSTPYYCEACYGDFSPELLIAVPGIVFQNSRRVTPWSVCRDCAQKISDALSEHVRSKS
jgi:hypothetical protein